ncbi:type II toxin-antitoxin system PemK/MazF family toxin [Telluria beijingensis]|uniref:type II toxin-antitoxin system PemK/MazF family toxin n=1 Tax=Telluria beijingensis TaxID=3068633 RepID=UPI002795FA84|nr:type II toxin-antitoxin system PemK/MazF family toxin [Massilia sp. REN29]
MVLPKVKRGEIWLVNLNPQGHSEEIAKDQRPCLVLQADLLNAAGYSTTVVIPCTTVTYRDENGDGFPLKVGLGKVQKPGHAPEETDTLVTSIRSVSNKRFYGDQPIGVVPRNVMKRVEDALKIILGPM